MTQFVWTHSAPADLLEESHFIDWTCGCNILHPLSKSKRHACTVACYEKKERKSIESDCVNRCKGWFTGKERRACKKVCKDTDGAEPSDREQFKAELSGDIPLEPLELNREATAGMGNTNIIIGVVIGLMVLIGAIIMFKK